MPFEDFYFRNTCNKLYVNSFLFLYSTVQTEEDNTQNAVIEEWTMFIYIKKEVLWLWNNIDLSLDKLFSIHFCFSEAYTPPHGVTVELITLCELNIKAYMLLMSNSKYWIKEKQIVIVSFYNSWGLCCASPKYPDKSHPTWL